MLMGRHTLPPASIVGSSDTVTASVLREDAVVIT
jgi:hypothetical protein